MAEIINFNMMKKFSEVKKVSMLFSSISRNHRSIMRYIERIANAPTSKISHTDTVDEEKCEIISDNNVVIKFQIAKSKSEYTLNIVSYFIPDIKIECECKYFKLANGFAQTTKKIKKIDLVNMTQDAKFRKELIDEKNDCLEGSIFFKQINNEITLIQENRIDDNKSIVQYNYYDEKMNLINCLRGFHEKDGYRFYDGKIGRVRITEKYFYVKDLKDFLNKKIRFNKVTHLSKDTYKISNDSPLFESSKNVIIDKLRSIPIFRDDYKEIFENLKIMREYQNVFGEEIREIVTINNEKYKYIKRKGTIFELQVEKYKCFWENDFLLPQTIVNEAESLAIDFMEFEECKAIKKVNNSNKFLEYMHYEDDFLCLKRTRIEEVLIHNELLKIINSEWNLETIDSLKYQNFSKSNFGEDGYREYSYICNPDTDKLGFKFLTREYFETNTLKEVLAFGKLNHKNDLDKVSMMVVRKNSYTSALLLTTKDEKNNFDSNEVMIPVAKIITKINAADVLAYHYLNDADLKFDANNQKEILDDIEVYEKILLEKAKQKELK